MDHYQFLCLEDLTGKFEGREWYEAQIESILTKTIRIKWVNLISFFSLKFYACNTHEELLDVQKESFSWNVNRLVIHRRNLLVLAQYLYSSIHPTNPILPTKPVAYIFANKNQCPN